jgi:glycosyltransferase involved in cell wall biosynthesis
MLAGLGEAGEVDFLCVASAPAPGRVEALPPEGVRMLRLAPRIRSKVERLRLWLTSGLPRSQLSADVSTLDGAIREWLGDRTYDLVYFSHIHAWLLHGHLLDAPVVVDFDNLDDLVIRAARTSRPVGAGWERLAKWAAMQPVDLDDERRMARLQRRCASEVDVVTLCSALDAQRSGLANAVAVGNGYDRTTTPPATRAGSRLVFVGALGYPPNADAVRWFVHEVLGDIRRSASDAVLRVVGAGEAAVEDLRGIEGVEILGRVDDLQPELDAATVAVVPIRSGSGTRLKVLEALANRLPIVATTLGAEGIDVDDGVHALLADDAPSFALACLRLVEDAELRAGLADAGERLWEECYRWSRIRTELAGLARRVARADAADQPPAD